MKNNLLSTLLFSSKGLRIIWSILAVILLIIICELIFVDPLSKLLSTIGLSEVTGAIPQNWQEAMGDSIKRVVRAGFVLLTVVLLTKYLLKKPLSFIGLNNKYKLIFLGLGLGFIVQIVSIVLMVSMGWFKVEGISWNIHSTSFLILAIIYSIIFCLETGVIEEVFFRGFLLNIFKNNIYKIYKLDNIYIHKR